MALPSCTPADAPVFMIENLSVGDLPNKGTGLAVALRFSDDVLKLVLLLSFNCEEICLLVWKRKLVDGCPDFFSWKNANKQSNSIEYSFEVLKVHHRD